MWPLILLIDFYILQLFCQNGCFYVDFHHGGQFDARGRYVGGVVSNWKCDGDRWSCFEILGVVKEMGYPGVLEIWYDFVGTLKELINVFGAIELLY